MRDPFQPRAFHNSMTLWLWGCQLRGLGELLQCQGNHGVVALLALSLSPDKSNFLRLSPKVRIWFKIKAPVPVSCLGSPLQTSSCFLCAADGLRRLRERKFQIGFHTSPECQRAFSSGRCSCRVRSGGFLQEI